MAPRFPRFELREALSPDVVQVNHTADVPQAFAQIAHASDQLGAELGNLAAAAARREGADAAARAIATGGAVPLQSDFTVKGQAFNEVARRYQATQRKAHIAELTGQAFAEHGDNPVALSKALDEIHAGLGQSGDPLVDAEVGGAWALHRADLMARAAAGARAKFEAQAAGNFLTDLQTGRELAGQVASGAPIDGDGPKRVSAAIQQLITSLSRYGPREAFEVAGVKFGPDETRQDAITPEKMTPLIQGAVAEVRQAWILAQAEKIPTETGRRLFAAEVQARWEKGDAAFTGIDAAQMDGLQRRLEAGADRLRTAARADRIEAAERARNAIEAFRWGSPDVDFNQALADAEASGDPGLVAQVRFYKDADPATRGVLATVYARQLGLIGDGAAGGVEWVNPTGQPIGDGTALAGHIGQDPNAFFGQILGPNVQITSAERTPEQNRAAHGAANSDHLRGRAWDIVVPGLSSAQVFARLRAAGVPFDQLLDEHDHVHFGLGPRMRGEALVKGADGSWTVPPGVQPGTPAYAAWASTKEGFSSDPLTFARGGSNRPAIAQVPVLVPDAAFAEGPPAQAWGQALAARAKLGQALARSYGVPARMLTNGEREYYQSQIEADPQRAVALAVAARTAAGPAAALALMRELGDTALEASTHLHIADLAAGGGASLLFAKSAAEGLAQMAEGARVPDERRRELDKVFEDVRGAVPAPVLQAARMTALAAATDDWKSGRDRAPIYYVRGALGATVWNGRTYGGPASVNGKPTVLPRWLAADRAEDALEALGQSWARTGHGAFWSNGEPVTAQQMSRVQLQALDNGRYRFIWPKSGNALRDRNGKVIEFDLDAARGFLAASLGPKGVRPEGD